MEELNEYELARARLIARNRERMAAMGLLGAANSLTAKQEASEAEAATKKPRPRPRPRSSPRAPQAPTRASKRLRGEKTTTAGGGSGEEGADVKEEEKEEEEYPPPKPRWTEEQLRELRRDEELRMQERLSDLELSGLIDASPGVAHFAIVGAHHKGQKRKHYRVTLEKTPKKSTLPSSSSAAASAAASSSSASCECIDFKIRRKKYGGHCKHIKLVLSQLGLGSESATSDGWEEALERVVMAKT